MPTVATSLHAAIADLIQKGECDPHRIARKLAVADHTWLVEALLERAEHLIAEEARRLIGQARRSSLDRALHSINGRAGRVDAENIEIILDWLDAPVFVPTIGWTTHRCLTADSCDLVAGVYRERETENRVWAERYEEFAARIRSAGVRTLGDVREA